MFCGGIARTLSLRSTRSHVAALDRTSSRLAFSRSTGSDGGCALRELWQPTQYLLTNARDIFASAAGATCRGGVRSRLRAVGFALLGPATPSATVAPGAWDRAAVPACPSSTAAPAQAIAAVAMNFVIASPGPSYQE